MYVSGRDITRLRQPDEDHGAVGSPAQPQLVALAYFTLGGSDRGHREAAGVPVGKRSTDASPAADCRR